MSAVTAGVAAKVNENMVSLSSTTSKDKDKTKVETNETAKTVSPGEDYLCHEVRVTQGGISGNIAFAIGDLSKVDELLSSDEAQTVSALKTKISSHLRGAKTCLQTALDSVNDQGTLVNDFLDFSSLEAGKLKLNLVDIDPRSIVDTVIKSTLPSFIKKQIKYSTCIDYHDEALVTVDPQRIKQVLLNLTNNAMKFTPERGRITITLEEIVAGSNSTKNANNANGVSGANINTSIVNASVNNSGNNSGNWTTLKFSVEDTGEGMEPEFKDRIFKPFQQRSGTAQKHGGTGLGLSICKTLVELMGGKIEVERTELNKGSTIAFTVPCRKVPKLQKASSPLLFSVPPSASSSLSSSCASLLSPDSLASPTSLTTPSSASSFQKSTSPTLTPSFCDQSTMALTAANSTKKKHILIVEDNEINRKILERMLGDMVTYDTAKTGAEAVELCAENDYDLVLMDQHLPDMTGCEATKKIRAHERQNPTKSPQYIIALTASTLTSTFTNEMSEAGMNGLLTKPYKANLILDEIQKSPKRVSSSKASQLTRATAAACH